MRLFPERDVMQLEILRENKAISVIPSRLKRILILCDDSGTSDTHARTILLFGPINLYFPSSLQFLLQFQHIFSKDLPSSTPTTFMYSVTSSPSRSVFHATKPGTSWQKTTNRLSGVPSFDLKNASLSLFSVLVRSR